MWVIAMTSTSEVTDTASTGAAHSGLWRWMMPVAMLVLIADQLSKMWAARELDEPVNLFWTLRLRFTENSGTAFSLGRGLGPFIGILAVAMVIVLIRLGRTVAGRVALISLGLILGGAGGNLMDRVLRAESGVLSGHVVDFIDFQWWPIFNVADMGIVVGAIMLLTFGFRQSASDVPLSSAVAGRDL